MFRRPFKFTRTSSDERQRRKSQPSESLPNNSSSAPPNLREDGSIREGTAAPQISSNSASQLLKPVHETDHKRRSSDFSRRLSEVDAGPLGLSVVYKPERDHTLDIVFIHGLGGTSHMTWSKNKDLELFWPYKFLSQEPEISQARILTFGYDADFLGSNITSSVLDFAKDLLFNLKNAKDDTKKNLRMGTVPIIFVVHSMGGLVIKEAYIQGQNDPEYSSIINSISAITFLATPHRGTNLAEVLKYILQSTLIIGSKRYVSELARNSLTLQNLNEQFRHSAPKLHIVSFYETFPTALGPKALGLFGPSTVMILKKDTSTLGYPGETSKGMSADHHNVCKYDSPTDPNYISIRDVLSSIINKILSPSQNQSSPSSDQKSTHDLRSLLSITELPDGDYSFFRDQWADGTSDWLLHEKLYLKWAQPTDSTSHILWLSGGPAAGKSVLSSFVINHLVEHGHCCQYFFVRFGNQKKRNLSFLLRSLAYQLGKVDPVILEKIVSLTSEVIEFEVATVRTIWERIFKSIVFKTRSNRPIYWIIDGIDEATDPSGLIKHFSEVSVSEAPIRVLLVSRKSHSIVAAIERLPKSVYLGSIDIEDHGADLSSYIRQELNLVQSVQYREEIIERLLERAQNNFLWVRLAIEKINVCHTQTDIELALEQLPKGMEALFDRMAANVAQSSSEDKSFTLAILKAVSCSLRTLTVGELSQATGMGQSDLLGFQRSVVGHCGGFVVIDNGGYVTMIHQTAREYLLKKDDPSIQVDPLEAHKQLFLSCIRVLMATDPPSKTQGGQRPDLLEYAATYWSSHLIATSASDCQLDEVLTKFLTGTWVLTWIHFLASTKQLRVLVQTSKHLSKYSDKRRAYCAAQNKHDHQILRQELFESWSIDLVKLVGKFGTILRRDAQSIYRLIPPFCPKSSSIYQTFGDTEAESLAISGSMNENWEDSLARISLGLGTYASSILAAGPQIAILASSGSVFIYDSSTFEECSTSPIKHGERIYRMTLNVAGTLLATYGYRTTKIWDISTGKCQLTMANLEERPRPLAMRLINNDTELLVGSEDRRLRSLNLSQALPQWQMVAELEEAELDGHFLNSSSYMALSKDGSLIAVAYRGHPLSAWETEGPVHIGHCWRRREELARGEVIQAVWHPHQPMVLGVYIEGVVFKWHPYEDEVEEVATGASRLSISKDGSLFATGDVHGKVKVYTTNEFGLLYQLASEDTILGLAFSPDLHRFYDIRGYFANAWEPNTLIKYAEHRSATADDRDESRSLAQTSTTFASTSGRVDSITAIAASPVSHLYCCGTDKGTLRLHDKHEGTVFDIYTSKSFLSIETITWSKDGRLIALSDSSKTVTIIVLTLGSDGSFSGAELKAAIAFKNNTNGPISQLLFRPNSECLAVYSCSTVHIISLMSYSLLHSTEMPTTGCKWIIHPRDTDLLMGIEPQTIHTLNWSLNKIQEHRIEPRQSEMSAADSRSEAICVDRILVTRDKAYVLVQMSLRNRHSREKRLAYFSTPSVAQSEVLVPVNDGAVKPGTIYTTLIPQDVASEVAMCLSFLPQNRLVFLSRTFAVCTTMIFFKSNLQLQSLPVPTLQINHRRNSSPHKSIDKGIKVLFWLPGDWVNADCLVLSEMWATEKSFMCPRNGEVAIVRCAALV